MLKCFGEYYMKIQNFDGNLMNFNFGFLCRKTRNDKSKKDDFWPFDSQTVFNEKHFQLSIHLSGGIFNSNVIQIISKAFLFNFILNFLSI